MVSHFMSREAPALFPERGASAVAHIQQALDCQGWRPIRQSASWILQLWKLSFVAMEKVGKKKSQAVSESSEGLWGHAWCVREADISSRVGWSCVCPILSVVYMPHGPYSALNHHLSTILLSPHLSHSPQTSVTSSDPQKPKKQTAKSFSLTLKAKDSPDVP